MDVFNLIVGILYLATLGDNIKLQEQNRKLSKENMELAVRMVALNAENESLMQAIRDNDND